MSSSVKIYKPDSTEPPFQPDGVPYNALMGKWFVVASTLPLWKGKKNVTITYTPIDGQPSTTFNDIVEYHSSKSALPTASKSTVKGVDRLDEAPLFTGKKSGAKWNWRGKGWLRIASSRWQLLGYHVGVEGEPEWAVTYFGKTLFTPAGLDVYARSGTALSKEMREAIIEAAKQCEDKTVASVAASFFDVPHDA